MSQIKDFFGIFSDLRFLMGKFSCPLFRNIKLKDKNKGEFKSL